MTIKGHSMSTDRVQIISCYRSAVTTALSCIVSHIAGYWSKIAKFIYPTRIQRPRRVDPTPSDFAKMFNTEKLWGYHTLGDTAAAFRRYGILNDICSLTTVRHCSGLGIVCVL